MPVFETEVTVATPIEQVFEYMSIPENLERLSPPEVGLKFIDAPSPLKQGDTFEFKVQAMGQIQKMKHRLVTSEAPTLMIEELVEGPLPRWRHTHTFVSAGDGQTKIKDQIDFEPPGGIIGMFLTEARILENLDDAYYYRQQQLKKIFGG